MKKSEEVDIRRRDISAYVAEHPTIGLDNNIKIAKALDMNIIDVQNDVVFLKEKLKEDYSQYNLGGLRDKARGHVDRLKKLQQITQGIINNNVADLQIKAIETEEKLINNIYHLEQDGIGPLTDEINDELGYKKNQEI